jgi:hypothetical protein
MKHIAIMLAVWAGSTIALGLIARVTYLVFMIGWGLV